MMKMAMRPHKKQVGGTLFQWVGGQSGLFKRGPYLQVGYRNFDVMAVAGAGGRSGKAGNDNRGYAHPSGGGGGGSARKTGLLINLPKSVSVSAGEKGENGSNSGVSEKVPSHQGFVEVKKFAEDGQQGRDSWFGQEVYAEGGVGGHGGEVSGPDYPERRTPSFGGEGGGNDGVTLTGTWDDVTKTGEGGYGGRGRTTDGVSPANGSGGANTGADNAYLAFGEPAFQNIGGTGGGANVQPILGSAGPIYFGTGSGTTQGQGTVILKIF